MAEFAHVMAAYFNFNVVTHGHWSGKSCLTHRKWQTHTQTFTTYLPFCCHDWQKQTWTWPFDFNQWPSKENQWSDAKAGLSWLEQALAQQAMLWVGKQVQTQNGLALMSWWIYVPLFSLCIQMVYCKAPKWEKLYLPCKQNLVASTSPNSMIQILQMGWMRKFELLASSIESWRETQKNTSDE